MLVYHEFRGDIASQIGTHAHACAKSKQPGQYTSETRPAAALECGLGLRRTSGAKVCQSKYQRRNKAPVRTLTRFVLRRAPVVAPLRLASLLALHRHRLRIMRARSGESTIGGASTVRDVEIYR